MYISFKFNGTIYLVSNSVPYNADFDNDGDVDGMDFLVWQRNVGSTAGYLSEGDANHDGLVDEGDLAIWQDQYGNSESAPLASQSVPEPGTAGLAVLILVSLLARERDGLFIKGGN
jgi:hypothetical protein